MPPRGRIHPCTYTARAHQLLQGRKHILPQHFLAAVLSFDNETSARSPACGALKARGEARQDVFANQQIIEAAIELVQAGAGRALGEFVEGEACFDIGFEMLPDRA